MKRNTKEITPRNGNKGLTTVCSNPKKEQEMREIFKNKRSFFIKERL